MNNREQRPLDFRRSIYDLFTGLSFCLSDNLGEVKKPLSLRITNGGGKISVSCLSTTDFFVSNSNDFQTQTNVRLNGVKAVKPDFVYDCLKKGVLLTPQSQHLLGDTTTGPLEASNDTDRFGDSYTVPLQSISQLKSILEKIPKQKDQIPKEFEKEMSTQFDTFRFIY